MPPFDDGVDFGTGKVHANQKSWDMTDELQLRSPPFILVQSAGSVIR